MNENKFYINDLSEIRAFCTNSDKEDVYKYIYSLQQENKQLKEKIKEIKEYIYDFIKHSSYRKKEIDEAIHQEFYNIMLIIKYAKEELKGSDKE